MASTFSTDLKLELMVTGENAGTWGDKTNTNLNLIQQAIAGVQSIDVAASDVTLVMSNATLSNARNMVLNLTGSLTGARQVLIPDGIEKNYIIKDSTTRNGFSLTIKTVSGTGFVMETSGIMVACFSDGTNVTEVSLNSLSGIIETAQLENLSITSGKLASFAVTSARLNSFAVTTSRLATNAVTAAKITQSTITQAKLAANSVGSNQLISTGVTAAEYTRPTITIDADGRITAASSGSASTSGMEIPVLYSVGPASGTYTANANATRAGVYMVAGAGGSGGTGQNNASSVGGTGGFGFFNKVITQPFSQPFSVGGGGNGGSGPGNPTGNPGNAGGATTIANIGTVNGGGGGPGGPGSSGSTGNAPGASLTYPVNTFIVGSPFSVGGPPTGPITIPSCPPFTNPGPGASGTGGVLAVFENIGT